MCIHPVEIPDGTVIACRQCWQCRERRINDWVGRCIAESKVAAACHSVTLTYGRDDDGSEDHERAAILTYSDVQKYFKRLRRAGYPLRYFAVGEYGSMKGRAHWHLIMFWQRAAPAHVLDDRFDEAHWGHGYSFFEKPSAGSIRYVCKYILKDHGDDARQGHLAMSKQPPLGDAWFRSLAERHVKEGLAPQTLEYSFPEARTRGGRLLTFVMHGKTAHNFLSHFVKTWERERGTHIPNSELVEGWQDEQARRSDTELRLEPYRRALRRPQAWDMPDARYLDRLRWSDSHNTWWYLDEQGCRWWWSVDVEGEPEWQKGKIHARRPAPPEPPTYREASRGT